MILKDKNNMQITGVGHFESNTGIIIGRLPATVARKIYQIFGDVCPIIQGLFVSHHDGTPKAQIFLEGSHEDLPFTQHLPPDNKQAFLDWLPGKNIIIASCSSGRNAATRAFDALLLGAEMKKKSAGELYLLSPRHFFDQDDKYHPGEYNAIGGETYPELLKCVGYNGIYVEEPHSENSIEYMCKAFGDNVYIGWHTDLFAAQIKRKYPDTLKNGQIVLGAPDGGDKIRDMSSQRIARLAQALGLSKSQIFSITKRRTGIEATPKIVEFKGNVSGKYGLIVDDIFSTGRSIDNAARRLMEEGALGVVICISHAVFLDNSLTDFLSRPEILHCYVTNTIPRIETRVSGLDDALSAKITVISNEDMIVEQIRHAIERWQAPIIGQTSMPKC